MRAVQIRNILLKHLKYISLLATLWGCYILTGIGCPFRTFFKITCPTCGVTRALIAFLSGDYNLYIQMNPFAVPLVFAVLAGFHLPHMSFKFQNLGKSYIIITVGINFCWYLIGLL